MENILLIRNFIFTILIMRVGSNSFDVCGSKIEFLKSNLLMINLVQMLNLKEFVSWHFTSLEVLRLLF